VLVLCALLVSASPALAQLSRPKADLQPLVAGPVHPGGHARLALRVSLPEGLHTQSNKPRQAYLIATVLTFQPTSGVAVDEIVWPASTDLRQAGNDTPLAVFDGTFLIGVQLTVDPAVKTGALTIPATIRYQACNASLCFAPQTASVEWTLPVVPKAKPLPQDPSTAAAFASIAFGTGEKPSASAPPAAPVAPVAAAPALPSASTLEMLDRFTIAGTTGGYQGPAEFLAFIHNAETGVKEKGWFEGRGPASSCSCSWAVWR
jgi:DsbC/DsbD-like thiol-disulfide interchange protein